MTVSDEVLFWKRSDVDGLERLVLTATDAGVAVASTVVCTGDGGSRLDHRWTLSPDWRALTVDVSRFGADGERRLALRRTEGGWTVNGERRADLDGTEEPDLSATPFCNTLAIRRTPRTPGAAVTLDTCFIDAARMTVSRSRQRYVRLGSHRLRYVDLGQSAGFEAELLVDARGLVLSYAGLFERIEP